MECETTLSMQKKLKPNLKKTKVIESVTVAQPIQQETKTSDGAKENSSLPATTTSEVAANKWLSFPESKFTNPLSAKPFSFGTESSASTNNTSSNTTQISAKPLFSGFTAPSAVQASTDTASTFKPTPPVFQFGQQAPSASTTAPPNLFGTTFSAPSSSTNGAGSGLGMFSIPPFGASAINAPISTALGANTAVTGEEDDGDDAGEPILEPEKALRNEQDTDEIVFEANSKLMRFDKGSKEWKDMGKGIFRITRTQDTKKPRMLMRSLTGKIMFNAGFHANISFEKVKGGVKFSAVTAADGSAEGELHLYIVKVKESEVATAFDKLTSMTK